MPHEGDVDIHVASLKPEGSAPAVKVLHHLVMCVVQQRIRIQNPYFLPDEEAIEALGKAVERGVDVRIMVPSADASDMPIVQHAAVLAAQFAEIFERDGKDCVELKLETWQARGAGHRILDNMLYTFNELL